jgi:excisionase family DNA binding protein
MNKVPSLLTAREVAVILRVPFETIHYRLRTGIIPGIRVGRSWRCQTAELERKFGIKIEMGDLLAARTASEQQGTV